MAMHDKILLDFGRQNDSHIRGDRCTACHTAHDRLVFYENRFIPRADKADVGNPKTSSGRNHQAARADSPSGEEKKKTSQATLRMLLRALTRGRGPQSSFLRAVSVTCCRKVRPSRLGG